MCQGAPHQEDVSNIAREEEIITQLYPSINGKTWIWTWEWIVGLLGWGLNKQVGLATDLGISWPLATPVLHWEKGAKKRKEKGKHVSLLSDSLASLAKVKQEQDF